jgi:hypothetical protein
MQTEPIQVDFKEPSSRLIDPDSNLSPAVFAGLLGINVSYVYQEAQKGRLPPKEELTKTTYRQALQMYLRWFKENQDLKILQAQQKHEAVMAKRQTYASEDGVNEGMPPLQAAKLKSDIRLNLAKEAALHQKNIIERGDYINSNELLGLCSPFLTAIKDMLLAIAIDFPETKDKIDQSMENLYNLGQQLIEKADADKKEYVQIMLDTEIVLEDL